MDPTKQEIRNFWKKLSLYWFDDSGRVDPPVEPYKFDRLKNKIYSDALFQHLRFSDRKTHDYYMSTICLLIAYAPNFLEDI